MFASVNHHYERLTEACCCAADHYRASADMLLNRLLKGQSLELFSIADWLSLPEEKERFFQFLQPVKGLGSLRLVDVHYGLDCTRTRGIMSQVQQKGGINGQ